MNAALDFAYAVRGAVIDRDYPFALCAALLDVLPWLGSEPHAGVHPLRGATACSEGLLLGGRTRLVLRAPAARAEECTRLQGRLLEVPAPLHVGNVTRRELLPYPVLHARLVVTGSEDEASFVGDIESEIEQLQIDCEIIVGRRGEVRLGVQRAAGFSLMLHGLSPEHSLRAQEHGLGLHRMLGCGLFVPHKSVAAVGA
ncbi:MAG: type I-MYXAN CRISPR-associated protein Cas6/Cmx6 [Gemmatimonadota bacterium]